MSQQSAVVNGRCTTAAFEWFSRVAEELELLEAGERSWRSDAADLLRAILDQRKTMTAENGELLAVVALELVGEEDRAALDHGLVTWRSLAADELSELAKSLRADAIPRDQTAPF
jgi:hypothetical protein